MADSADRPVLLTVDDEPTVLRAVARDLRARYGGEYRILRASSGDDALEVIRDLHAREVPVALILADQRMPGTSGTELLEAVRPLVPDAKRALLTAYADTDAAIDAINRAGLDYYLIKPWDPPEERLYPTLDDLLADWRAAYRPPFRGIRVVGDRWSETTHRIKDFLSRNQIPYRWLDVERSAEATALLSSARTSRASAGSLPPASVSTLENGDRAAGPALPVVFFPDGPPAERPSNEELAERVGLQTHAARPFYDLVVAGAGPAGMAAAVYGASEGLSTLLIEREAPGGQAGTSSRIENYLGFPAGLSGADLARRATAQARKFGVEILTPQQATALRIDGPYRYVTLGDGSEVACHALVVSTGVQYRTLNLDSAEALTGRGVYYGASTSEAIACTDEAVYVVGAGNSAGQAALYLADYAATVTMLVRGDSLAAKMSSYLVDRIDAHPGIRVLYHTEIQDVHGSDRLEALTVANSRSGETSRLDGSAVFLFIGARPRTEWLGDAVARDPHGFIYTGRDLAGHGVNGTGYTPTVAAYGTRDREPLLLETSVPGIFATGDVRHGSVKRVAAAVGEGSTAISAVHEYLAGV